MDSRAYWVWLQQALGVGSRRIANIVREYGSPAEFHRAGPSEWRAWELFTDLQKDRLCRCTVKLASEAIAAHEAVGIQVITPEQAEYPRKLLRIEDYPAALYVRGTLPSMDDRLSIAIVGTRSATFTGLKTARAFSKSLAEEDTVVVSGGALGIDRESHLGAIDAGGKTVCVLGCGVDYPYLMANAGMRRAIERSGALVSESMKDTRPIAGSFPIRNRIISGLADGTLVVEADRKSGSLITADRARKQGRTVFAVPGPILCTTSQGTNDLIKSGARMVTNPQDILGAFGERYPALRRFQPEPEPSHRPEHDDPPSPRRRRALEGEQQVLLPVRNEEPQKVEKTERWGITRTFGSDAQKKPKRAVKSPDEWLAELEASIAEEDESLFLPRKTEEIRAQNAEKPVERRALPESFDEEAKRVYSSIPSEPITLTQIANETGLPVARILIAVTKLELAGYIVTMAGSRFRLP